MNRSDTDPSEFNNLASNDTENSEIVEGVEGNLPPISDFDAEDTDLVVVPEQAFIGSASDVAPEFEDQASFEDHPVTIVSSDDVQEPLLDVSDKVEVPLLEQKTLQLPQQVSGWQRLQRIFIGGSSDDIARLHNLTQSIEDAPESSVNYVLRAELYMKMREYALAQSDFQRAYELAETNFELADWGLLEQVMRDRALTGLEKVQRRLQ